MIGSKRPQKTQTLTAYQFSIGALNKMTYVLLWERYGYDDGSDWFPDWAQDALRQVKELIPVIQPSDLRWEITDLEHGNFGTYNKRTMLVQGRFRCWDEANPWADPWEVSFKHMTEASAYTDYENEFKQAKRLHDGIIAALLYHKETGEVVPPFWFSQKRRYWEKDRFQPGPLLTV